MKKSRLTKILIEGDSQLIKDLASQVENNYLIQTEKPPQTGLTMVKVKDSISNNPFYMGEVLVTECTVSINGTFGMSVIMGEKAETAYQIAIIDAAMNSNLPMTKDWFHLLLQEEKNIDKRQQKELAMVNQTKVHFNTMEDYNDKS
ncbi:phosphonate C-P lyase system protein PhnG [Gracilibacillus sp. YIM 98692]|uniref:phosphonate C-P lyase system protein PhnG n=1 Tax=Gracilibacillus sp. YIM 98692 TaxID=2663532 RepID=UPI0013D3C824|nr:phosphonate C-P lyase system protein PhnG [Gracilibacillus sp. YIM 98692]